MIDTACIGSRGLYTSRSRWPMPLAFARSNTVAAQFTSWAPMPM